MAASASDLPPPQTLEAAARSLAQEHGPAAAPAGVLPVYNRLSQSSAWLTRVARYCADPQPDHNTVADWLLDNDYLVLRAVRQITEDLPISFYRQLPALEAEQNHRLPRVFALAHAAMLAMHKQLVFENLVSYCNAYQELAPLTMAELWALPSMLRLASLEILAHGFRQLNPDLAPPWEISLHNPQLSAIDATDRIAHSISALASIHSIEWTDFFDQTSCVERILDTDPAQTYAAMDFQSRDQYRHTVERLAQRSAYSEIDVASSAIKLASAVAPGDRKRHVGFWLIDQGKDRLEQELQYRQSWSERAHRFLLAKAGLCYALSTSVIFVIVLMLPAWYLYSINAEIRAWLYGLLLLALPASVVSLALVHWLMTSIIKVRVLPALDFNKGIPPECKTAVVVPVIISRQDEIPELILRLEQRRLANPDPALSFVLLSDLKDADQETTAGDTKIEASLLQAFARLNEQYSDGTNTSFYLLHRRRQFNPAENCWMGRERKRGKIESFNQFILSGKLGEFSLCDGDVSKLREVRYVITLDADTMLPPTTAARLVGTIAHPLNRAEWDKASGKLLSGYSIIQPRLEVLPLSSPVSLFCRFFAGDTAIDIYSQAVSDLYQDLFGSGTFVGKGIYDVASFHRCLQNRVPDNTVLSHDLFEGAHARTALASNIILYENFPVNYPEYALRLHRWIRGDWQLLPWLGGAVPSADGTVMPQALSPLDRWKIIDNLRRSLITPALLLLLLCGWTFMPGSPWLWTLLAILAPGVYLVGDLFNRIAHARLPETFADFRYLIAEKCGRWFLSLTFLVSDTLVALDAIARTLWRVGVSRRGLLQWRSAAHVQDGLNHYSPRQSSWRLMWPSSLFAIIFAAGLAFYQQAALVPAAPLLLLWLTAPEIAIWLGHTREPRRQHLNEGERDFLFQLARRTWHFFDAFAGPDDNWLPPDNFQSDPKGEVAHRTSPTNIGMLLTSATTAHDFGFICIDDFVVRMRNLLDSLDRLATYRGHLLNWYDTKTLQPLEPRYVSTVDSGNLAVCLVALKQGCLDYANGPVSTQRLWSGLQCTLALLIEAVRELDGQDSQAIKHYEFLFEQAFPCIGAPATQWHTCIAELVGNLWPEFEDVVAAAVARSSKSTRAAFTDVRIWVERFHHGLHALYRQLNDYQPWLALLASPPPACEDIAGCIAAELPPDIEITHASTQIRACEVLIQQQRDSLAQQADARFWLERLEAAFKQGYSRHQDISKDLLQIASRAERLAFDMDFSLLYDPKVRLFRIGYNVSTGQDDHNHYDLLASEARIASFFAIAKRDVPMEHWFALGRPVARLEDKPVALSWSGSMFEYLMPALFMPGHRDTLLGESESVAVQHQRHYAAKREIPWGISESAFAITDADGNYQYKAFGVPGLGLRRGLSEDLVVAPYASALALLRWPGLAVENLRALARLTGLGAYGFIDALDFTHRRSPQGAAYRPVKTYMAHHQGMIAAAIANALDDDILVRRVMSDKHMQTFSMLLQERLPWAAPVEKGRIEEVAHQVRSSQKARALQSWVPSTLSTVPQFQIIGNGRMSTWQSEAGAGGINWRGFALTRWLPDSSGDCHGYWFFVKDIDSHTLWSAARLPTGAASMDARTVFHPHMVEHFRRNQDVAVRMETTVAPDDDVDIRRITVLNEGARARTIELTSYAEVVLAPALDDERHPAFSKLFVGSEFDAENNGLLFTRRPRRRESPAPQLLHMPVINSPALELVGYETDRSRFIGRNGCLSRPQGLSSGLSQTTGWTLDPVMALTVRATLEPNASASFSLLSIAAHSRAELQEIVTRYRTASLDWAFRDSARMAAREVAKLELDPSALPNMQALASLLLHPHPRLRTAPAHVGASYWGQEELWRFGISGDLPILLLRIAHSSSSDLLKTLIKAQHLWRIAGLSMDIVVLRTGSVGYEDPLRENILAWLRDADAYGYLGRRGGIHLLYADHLDTDALHGIGASAHVVLDDDNKPLSIKLDQVLEHRTLPPQLEASEAVVETAAASALPPLSLEFNNGSGGFDQTNGDYIIDLKPGQHTPAPWCNILANDQFGTVVSESGLGFSWAANSGENRLTQSSNDPVSDFPGEVLYLRDEVTAQLWTVTPAPVGGKAACRIRHGAGFTRWQKHSHGLSQDLLVFVPPGDPVKLIRLKLTNNTEQPRRLTATYYAHWLLGALASNCRPHIVCEYDSAMHAIIAHNPWRSEFSQRVAFVSSTNAAHSVSGNRYDFLGHEGALHNPAGLRMSDLGGNFSAGGDSCAAYQVHLDLAAGETTETVFILGQDATLSDTHTLIKRYRDPGQVAVAFAELQAFWSEKLDSVQVKTPDRAFDLMVNRWLIYQTLVSRMMARAGFYQASGAFGFRDQLQDSLALLNADPQRVRNHILRTAQHQFEEGDVQHWWHPPTGRGVRTHCSDDYIWLAYVTARYVDATADDAILDCSMPFLVAPPLRSDEHDRYAKFDRGSPASLFEHCCRALDHMQRTGAHGLPLMGAGDWNDGMDRVGAQGRGESVWLAWFQIATINEFSPLAERRGYADRATHWQQYAQRLKTAIDESAWDGEWFIRALDDSGIPWGSQHNDECKIDSIAQSWAVLAGFGSEPRVKSAMLAAQRQLVREEDRLILLLDPPFHKSLRDPGYIQAYPPGIRENGGQYTHAASWLGIAFAGLGDGDSAWRIFDILNPIRRTAEQADVQLYQREPFVLAGDIYSRNANKGRGGWSWYTGAAGWTWQLGVAGILGLRPKSGGLMIDPCLPKHWGGAEITIRRERTIITVLIEDPDHIGRGVKSLTVNGKTVAGNWLQLTGQHEKDIQVLVRLGRLTGTDD